MEGKGRPFLAALTLMLMAGLIVTGVAFARPASKPGAASAGVAKAAVEVLVPPGWPAIPVANGALASDTGTVRVIVYYAPEELEAALVKAALNVTVPPGWPAIPRTVGVVAGWSGDPRVARAALNVQTPPEWPAIQPWWVPVAR